MVALVIAALVLGFACGSVSGFRRGRDRTWLLAALSVGWATRGMAKQLANAERALAEQGEIRHAAARDPGPWLDNGAGYRSTRHTDSPTRAGAGQPNKESNDHAKAG